MKIYGRKDKKREKKKKTMETEPITEITQALKSREQGRYTINLLDFIKLEDILYETKNRYGTFTPAS